MPPITLKPDIPWQGSHHRGWDLHERVGALRHQR